MLQRLAALIFGQVGDIPCGAGGVQPTLLLLSIDSPVAMKSLANSRVISDVFTVVNRLSVGKEQMLRNLADAGLRCHYALSQFFARPEMGDVPGLDGHLVSRGRVSS
jgi:hypothetical protein